MAEILGTATNVIDLLARAKQLYQKFKDVKDLPQAFDKITAQIDLAKRIFESIESDDRIISQRPDLQAAINSCQTNASGLNAIYELVNNNKRGRWHQRYKEYVKGLSDDRVGAVEALWGRLLSGTQLLAAGYGLQELAELGKAIAEIQDLPSSLVSPGAQTYNNAAHTVGVQGHNSGEVTMGNKYMGDHNEHHDAGGVGASSKAFSLVLHAFAMIVVTRAIHSRSQPEVAGVQSGPGDNQSLQSRVSVRDEAPEGTYDEPEEVHSIASAGHDIAGYPSVQTMPVQPLGSRTAPGETLVTLEQHSVLKHPHGKTSVYVRLEESSDAHTGIESYTGENLLTEQQQLLRVSPKQLAELSEGFRASPQPDEFFQLGKVFLAVYTDRVKESDAQQKQSSFTTTNGDGSVEHYDKPVYYQVRCFIVVREGMQSCTAVNVTRYDEEDVAQRIPPGHGIIYTAAESRSVLPSGEDVVMPTPIRVNPFERGNEFPSISMINYGKLYSIEHSVKAIPYGVISRDCMHDFVKQWALIVRSKRRAPSKSAFRNPDEQNIQRLGFSPIQTQAVLLMLATRDVIKETDPCDVIVSVARASAKKQFEDEGRPQAVVELCANNVVDLILAGMDYLNAVSYARQISAGV